MRAVGKLLPSSLTKQQNNFNEFPKKLRLIKENEKRTWREIQWQRLRDTPVARCSSLAILSPSSTLAATLCRSVCLSLKNIKMSNCLSGLQNENTRTSFPGDMLLRSATAILGLSEAAIALRISRVIRVRPVIWPIRWMRKCQLKSQTITRARNTTNPINFQDKSRHLEQSAISECVLDSVSFEHTQWQVKTNVVDCHQEHHCVLKK